MDGIFPTSESRRLEPAGVERKVTIPDGSVRYGLMTYKPNIVDGGRVEVFVCVALM